MSARKVVDFHNWIPGPNRFGLSKPPEWWLKKCFDFDPDLILVPSQTERVYRLARRVRYSAGIGKAAFADGVHPDTALLAGLGLVPCGIALIPAIDGSWSLGVFEQLAARDIWRHGGPKKFTDALESNEQAASDKTDAGIRDEMMIRRRDLSRTYKHMTSGNRLPSVKPPRRAKVFESTRRVPTPPVGSPIILASS